MPGRDNFSASSRFCFPISILEKDLVVQYNDFRKQVAENKKRTRLNIQEKDEQLAKLQEELQMARTHAEQQAKENNERLRRVVGTKDSELSSLMAEHREVREQRAMALKAAADKELKIVKAMQAEEEAQKVAEDAHKAAADAEEFRKKAEDNKNRALNSLMLEDYMRGGPSGHPSPAPKHEFSKLCTLINTPEGCAPNDMEGVRYLHDIKPNMREKILYDFVSMGDILYDIAAVRNTRDDELDIRSEEYLRHNVPPHQHQG